MNFSDTIPPLERNLPLVLFVSIFSNELTASQLYTIARLVIAV